MSEVGDRLAPAMEIVTLWGQEWEVIAHWKLDPPPADHILPNGRLDLSKYGPIKDRQVR